MDSCADCPLCASSSTRKILEDGIGIYHECPECGLLFLLPGFHPSREKERARYGTHRNTADSPGYVDFLNRLALPLLERVPAGSRGLDYGCGKEAVLADMLRDKGLMLSLYDPFFHPAEETLKEQYDFIACSEVVEHFHHPAAEFERLRAMVRPGGILAIMTSVYDDSIDFSSWYYRRDYTHVVFYRESTFRFIADRLGMAMEHPDRNILFLRREALAGTPRTCLRGGI